MGILKNIKQTEIYQVYFVRAIEKSKRKVIWTYFFCGLLVAFSYNLLSDLQTDYRPLNQLPSLSGQLVKIHFGGRGFPPQIVVEVDGEQHAFSALLTNIQIRALRKNLPSSAQLSYLKIYSFWPSYRNRALYLVVNNKIERNYTNETYERLYDRESEINFIVFSVITSLFFMIRIWIKYK